MNIEEIRDKQRALDEMIHWKYGLTEQDTIESRITALSVEVAEMANEAKFFKYWSLTTINRAKLLEECVDVLHFAASIANTYKLHVRFYPHIEGDENDIHTSYLSMQQACTVMLDRVNQPNQGGIDQPFDIFMRFFSDFLYLARIEPSEVMDMYQYKNRINHKRQQDGY